MACYDDLELLRDVRLDVDRLIPRVSSSYQTRRNDALRAFYDVTWPLVEDYGRRAREHVILLLDTGAGLLYRLAESKLFNAVEVHAASFPLLDPTDRSRILKRVEALASELYEPRTLLHDITCLELLYFFALLVNPESNWVTLDYVSRGNRHHAYVVACFSGGAACDRKHMKKVVDRNS